MTRCESKHVAHIVINIFKNFIKCSCVWLLWFFPLFLYFKQVGIVNVKISQEINLILLNSKVHYCIQRNPTTCPHLKPDRCPHFDFLKIYIDIIFLWTPVPSEFSLSLSYPHQNPVYISLLSHTFYMTRLSHSSRFYHPNIIWLEVEVINLLIT